MLLNHPVPRNILQSQKNKLVASPTAFKRSSPQARRGVIFNTLFFKLAVGEAQQVSGAWARGFLLIQNQDFNPLFVDFGRPATGNSYSLTGSEEFRTEDVCPCNSINLYAPNGCFGVIIEG